MVWTTAKQLETRASELFCVWQCFCLPAALHRFLWRKAATKKKIFMERSRDDSSHDAASGSLSTNIVERSPKPRAHRNHAGHCSAEQGLSCARMHRTGSSGFSAFCQLHVRTRFPN